MLKPRKAHILLVISAPILVATTPAHRVKNHAKRFSPPSGDTLCYQPDQR